MLSLAGVYFWAGTMAASSSWSAFGLALLLIPALGFKEFAAVLPLQMLLLALAWRGPLLRSQRAALFAAFVAAGLFLAWRVFLFGNAWQVYTTGTSVGVAMPTEFWRSLLSFGPWWAALAQSTPVLSAVYVVCAPVGILLLALARPVPQWRLALALSAAFGGLVHPICNRPKFFGRSTLPAGQNHSRRSCPCMPRKWGQAARRGRRPFAPRW